MASGRKLEKEGGEGGEEGEPEEAGYTCASASLEHDFQFYAPLTLGENYVKTLLDPSVLDTHKFWELEAKNCG